MSNELDVRMGDVVLIKCKLQSCGGDSNLIYGEMLSTKSNVAFFKSDIESIISRAETPQEEIARLKAEIAQAPRKIEWSGGECPVDENTRILAWFNDGDCSLGSARNFRWRHLLPKDGRTNIIAYMELPE